jgi:hypothetical protein
MTTRASAAKISTAADRMTKKRRSKLPLYEVVLVVLFFSAPLAAKSWRITDFQDSISVDREAKIVVTERITMAFVGEWHGIYRKIPIQYPGPNGTSYRLYLDVARVTDGEGSALKYDSSVANGMRDLKIYIPDAVDATRTVEIIYSARNGIRFFKDYDEFYWNVTGNDWPVPIEHASAVVEFPGIASGSLRAQAFTGVYGSVDRDATDKVENAEASSRRTVLYRCAADSPSTSIFRKTFWSSRAW